MRARALIFLILPLVLLWLPLRSQAQSQLWSGVLAPARAMDWTKVGAVPGAPGSLPSASWTQCGSTIAAYSGSATTINNALSSCSANHYVLLGPGTFTLNTPIAFPKNTTGHIALRGAGASSTIISFTGSGGACNGTDALICIASNDGTYAGGPNTSYNWTAGYAQGATQITLSSVSGIVVGQTILVLNACDTGFSGSNCTTGASIDNGNYFVCSVLYNPSNGQGCGANGPDTGAWRPNAFQQEMVLVTAINAGGCGSTCVTLSQPLKHPNWATLSSPQAVVIQPIPQVGVENLKLDGAPAGIHISTGIGFQNAYECWVSGVMISNMYTFAIYGLDTAQMTIQSNYIYHSNGHPDAYGIRLTLDSDSLVQNNIIQQWKNSFANDGPAVGEVIAYNFSIDQIIPSPTDQMWGSFWTHSAGDDFMLREGNAGDQAQDDNVHGTHLNQTSLRNFFWGFESCINGTTGANQCGGAAHKDQSSTAFVESSGVRYANNVGNILGTPGFTTTYQTSVAFSAFAAWNIGGGNGGVGLPTDPLVGSTMLRWGNWDVVNNAALFCTAKGSPIGACPEDDRGSSAPLYPGLSSPSTTIPSSFYLSSKPGWFGSTPWPAVGADVSGGNIGQCSGTIDTTAFAGLPATNSSQCASGRSLSTAWGGHVNAIPAMNCFLNVMGGPPDGTGNALTFDPSVCYGNSPPPPGSLQGTAH